MSKVVEVDGPLETPCWEFTRCAHQPSRMDASGDYCHRCGAGRPSRLVHASFTPDKSADLCDNEPSYAGLHMQYLSFWIVVLFIPLLVVLGNGLVRWLNHLPQSASADLILAFVVFDATVAIQAADFKDYVKAPWFREHVVGIYVGLIIANFFIWNIAAFRLENALMETYNLKTRRYNQSPGWLIFLSFLISVFVFTSNTLIFAYGG